MRGVNKVIIVGTLGADPDVRQFPNGGSVTNISVATSEQWTDKQTGERRESTEWHRISLHNKLGEIAAQYLRKGRQVYIEGSLRTRKYQDQTGQERYITEIRADQMQMLGGNGGQGDGGFAGGNNTWNQPQGQGNGGYQAPNNFGNAQANPYANQGQGNQGGYNQNAPMPQSGFGAQPAQVPQPQNYGNAGNQFANNMPNNAPAANPQVAPNPATPKPGAVDDDIPF